MTTDEENEIEERFKIFPFPDDETFVCGSCFAHRDYVHVTGGYNFKDLMERKYRPIPAGFDPLNGQHIVLKYKNGKLKHRIEDLAFSRLIGGSCAFSSATGTAYCFGGIHEEIGINSDLNTFFVSNLLVTHRFREKMSPIRTFVTPIGVAHPLGRVFHCSTFDYDRNSIWIYGGGTSAVQSVKDKRSNRFSDLWEYQTQTQIWVQHQIQRPLLERWGRTMAYFDNKLFVYGGTDKISQKSFWQLDLTDMNNLKWKTFHIPDKMKSYPMGCSMQLVMHPTLGPRILIIGGSNDDIYTSLGFSVDLNVEQSPKSLFPLHIISFDPLRYTFSKVPLSSSIPNVSFHGTAIINENLFLIGGLNHCNEGRAFCKNIIILDIFYYLDKTYENKYSVPFDYPEIDVFKDDYTNNTNIDSSRRTFNHFEFPELKNIVNEERNKVMSDPRLQNLNDLFEKHSVCPFPLEEFTLIRDQYCSNVIIRQRIGEDLPNFSEIPINYAKDFVYYLYTGSLHHSSKFVDLRTFIIFLIFCWRLKFVRLMLLEICFHIDNFTPTEILKISALSLDGTLPLVDDPQFKIVKYILFNVLETVSSHPNEYEVDYDPSDLFLISHYLIPLLGSNPQYKKINLPPFPFSTVLNDLLLFNTATSVTCKDCTLKIDSTLLDFDPNVVNETNHNVVIAVSKLSLKPILDSVDDLFSALKLINSIQSELSKSMLLEILNDSLPQINIVLMNDPRLKQLLVDFLPSINHRVLLEQCINFIGSGCTTFMLDRKGRELRFNQQFSKLYQPFAWIQLDISFQMLNLLFFIIYSGIDPNDIKIKINKAELAKALLAVCGDHPFLLPINIQSNCLKYIQNILINDKNNLTNEFIVENFIRLFNLKFIDQVVRETNIKDWIELIAEQVIQSSSKDISKWYLVHKAKLKI